MAYLIENQLPAAFIGDVTRVRQILVNLLSNAVKFTETGEIVISVKGTVLEQVPKVDDYPTYTLQFSVRDTGIGIPKRRLSRLFRSFSQVDASTTRRYGGTGLGLAISKQLSELMGGTMWVESEVNRGSTFYFTVKGRATASREPVTWSGEQPDLADKRVLVVDDNATNQRILEKYALSWGMRPTLATNGPDALKLLQQDPPFDVAILDVQMPFMDGVTLAKEIRNHYHSTSLPIIMLTSLGRQEINSEAIEFTTYLNKPLKPSLLYNALIEIMVGTAPTKPQKFIGLDQFQHNLGQEHPLHILLAEDNLVNQKVALGILDRIGYRADVAANGLEVLEALQRQSYDVVLMDIQMPDMDGVTATQKIRERFSPKDRPHIIAMTAHALQGDREKYLAVGMDDYLTKPVRIKELIETLNRYQSKSGRSDPANGNRPAQEPAEAAGSLDHSVLREFGALMGEDGPGIITELIDLFLQDSPGLLADLRHGVETSDAELIRYTAHTLKSSSASLGAMGLSALCETLEAMGKTANLDQATEKVDQAEAQYHQVKLELKEMWQKFEQDMA